MASSRRSSGWKHPQDYYPAAKAQSYLPHGLLALLHWRKRKDKATGMPVRRSRALCLAIVPILVSILASTEYGPRHTTTIWTQSNSTVSSPGFLKVNCTARASGASPNCAAYDKGSRRIGPGLPGAGVNFPSADDSYPELNCLNQTGVHYAKAGGGLSPIKGGPLVLLG